MPARAAAKLASALEPKIIIPTLFDGPGSDKLKEFLSEAGDTKIAAVDKLSIKRKDLENKEAEVVVLSVA